MALDLQKKYLVQDITEGASFDTYERYLLATTSERQFVIPGVGKEVTYKNQHLVQPANKNDFGGGLRTDRHDMENYIMSDTIEFKSLDTNDAGVVDIILDESEWLYPAYFLSGKMEEQYNMIKNAMAPTMRKYEFTLAIKLHEEIATNLAAATPTVWSTDITTPTSAYIQDTRATTQIPALTDFELLVTFMGNDNREFAYGPYMSTPKKLPDGFYVNAKAKDLVYICTPELKYSLQNNLHNWSVRDKEKFEKIVESFIDTPYKYKDPQTGNMVDINFLSNDQILVIEKKYVDRIYNYAKELSQYWAQNDTIRYTNKLREVVGAYKFTSVALFECEGLTKVVSPA